VIAATNRDLDAAITEGSFRQDLFYRLNVFPIQVPPLRERGGDVPLLVEYLVERYAKKEGKRIRRVSNETLALLKQYGWPGNVRELQNVIERAVILCESETLSIDASWLRATRPRVHGRGATLTSDLAAREKEVIESALRESSGRVSGGNGAAARLGIPRQTLESKLKKLGINRYRYRPS
jgi:formate hydrogenlyase transcriptional activator